MNVVVSRIDGKNWERVRRCARFTIGKDDINGPVSDKFKRQMLIARHSVLRELEFSVEMYGIPSFVSVHLVRHHIGANHYVGTSRPDRTELRDRHEQRKDDPCNHLMTINAAELLHLCEQRLCSKAEEQTRMVVSKIVAELSKIEPLVAGYCKMSCVRIGFCPEHDGCRFCYSHSCKVYRKELYGDS